MDKQLTNCLRKELVDDLILVLSLEILVIPHDKEDLSLFNKQVVITPIGSVLIVKG